MPALPLNLGGREGFGGFGQEVFITLAGLAPTLRTLRHLNHRLVFDVVVKATRAGAAPIVKAAKRGSPRRKGHMKKSITQKLKRYRGNAKVLSIIGPRDQKLADGANPGKYTHLVEGGTKPHVIRARHPFRRLMFQGDDGPVFRRSVRHPGSQALRFLARAVSGTKIEAAARFADKMRVETEAAALKEATRG